VAPMDYRCIMKYHFWGII